MATGSKEKILDLIARYVNLAGSLFSLIAIRLQPRLSCRQLKYYELDTLANQITASTNENASVAPSNALADYVRLCQPSLQGQHFY